MQHLKSQGSAQRFLATHAAIANAHNRQRHSISQASLHPLPQRRLGRVGQPHRRWLGRSSPLSFLQPLAVKLTTVRRRMPAA